MKSLACLFLTAAAAVLPLSSAMAADSTVGAGGVVVQPLTLVRVQDMSMGRLSAGASGGTVSLTAAGARTATGSVTLMGTTHQQARFAGQGSSGQTVQITLPSAVTLTGPGANMAVTNFDFGPSGALPGTFTRIGTTDQVILSHSSGIFGFDVGADLAVGANQAAGTYSASFSVTADYQ